MFERILLPLDGSEVAEITLPYAEELAGKLGSELVLYHIRGHDHAHQEHMHQMYLDRLAESVRHNISKVQPMGEEVKVTTKVEAGEPTENICNLVDKNKMDLIIMTAVSTSGIRVGKMIGSVADHVCRTVPIPVLLIRPNTNKQVAGKDRLISRLLIPVDGSGLSKLALPVGEELATKLKASVTLFQMATMIRLFENAYGSESVFVNYAQLDAAERVRVGVEMSALDKDLKEKGLDVTHIVTTGFDAASEIIEVSKKVSADLVVMSTHGRSGLTHWVLGSVAEKVLRHGEIPLLLVHARAS